MNSKQIVAGVGAIALIAILVYPALSTGTLSVELQATKFQNADHVYVTITGVWAHRTGQSTTSGWEQISNETQNLDLVTLQSSPASIGKAQLSVAEYDSVRIDVLNVTWAFNKTSTTLQLQSAQLPATVDFTLKGGKQTTITLVIGGQEQTLEGTKFFTPSLNATVTST